MRTAILINRVISASEISEISSITSGAEPPEIFTTSRIDYPFSATLLNEDSEVKKNINYQVMDRILEFGDLQIQDKTLSEHLTFSGLSLWHYHKFRIYFQLRNLAYENNLLKKLSEQYDSILCYGLGSDNDNLNGLAYKIKYKHGAKDYKTKKRPLTPIIRYVFYLLIRFLIGFVNSLKPRKYSHILLDRASRQPCLNIETLQTEQENYNLTYLFAKADKNFLIVDEAEQPKFSEGQDFKLNRHMFFHHRKHINRLPGEFILLAGLLNPFLIGNFRSADKAIRKILDFINSAGLNAEQKWILNRIKQHHSATRLYVFKNLAWQRFLKWKSIQTISSIDENSPAVRSILDAAKKMNIHTIGIQHGSIHELHPAYRFTNNDILNNVICDTTIVWGDYWFELLRNTCHYPAHKLIIAGQPRTDIIPVLSGRKVDLIRMLDLPDKKIVVFASQQQQDPLLRERAAYDVFQAVTNLADVHLIVKLHPSEAGDPDYYHNITRSAGCMNYSVTSSQDLYQLLSASDIVITCFSTVGAESVYFEKPLIILDHLHQDIQGYIRQKVAFMADNSESLKETIVSILNGTLVFDKQAYQEFIHKNSFRIDGKTSERILDIIRCSSQFGRNNLT